MTFTYSRLAARIESTLDSLAASKFTTIFIFFLAIPVIVFWRPYYFFRSDDWTALTQMALLPFWQYLHSPDAEQWFPFFHLVYYALIKIAGDRYSLLVLANSLLTGVNAFLVYQFLQIHLDRSLSLILSVIYAGATLHTATICHTYNLCYIMSFGFFLGALLLTARYLQRSSALILAGIGLCCLLALLSHSFAILAIAAVPLYGLLLGAEDKLRKFLALAGVIALVYLVFACGYFTFAGTVAATSHNRQLLSGLPGLSYYLYAVVGGILSPNYHLFRTDLFGRILAETLLEAEYKNLGLFLPGLIIYLAAVGLTMFKGASREKRLVLWVILANLLPFVLVGLARYQISLFQAASDRYGVFTLLGTLLLMGTGWRIFLRNLSGHSRASLVAVPLLALIIASQVSGIMYRQSSYKKKSLAALAFYRSLASGDNLAPAAAGEKIRIDDYEFTRGQALAIKRFLQGH
jgi:hypothetical protein